ncbi:DNA-3-methyladenine glycosylase 2 family protein [Streptomyces sp. A7024]|uniref:DNA-3-methyladenine glycosylase 2 family protein n=1 Tax=Streptomyces coryli TaxID=1128680 RepID=A0A6G4UAN7_9ACTN|nr:DNA-3-methyladenine glycosylase 2 family protein [Streptomyces coryli]NGN68387.1 DNA-3-methyladenine glycosylase 2 family protein [Streptomyces coryli]
MATPLRRRVVPPGPYDLRRSLRVLQRGPGDPAYRVAGGAVWRSSRTPAGAGTLRIRTDAAAGAIEAEAWGPGAEWLLEQLPALLGVEDEPEAFAPRHKVVARAWLRNPGIRLVRTGLVLESLIPSILEQKVTTDEAYRAWRLLLWRHGEPAPGPAEGAPRLRVMPDPRGWARIPSWEWHRAGVDAKRSDTAVRAARVAPRLEEAAAMDEAAASRRLQLVSGIGPWTAAETLQRVIGAPDAVTVGDLHLPRMVGYSLAGERDADDPRMLELLEPYATQSQRHRATRYITLGGTMPPRREPKRQIWDIAAL